MAPARRQVAAIATVLAAVCLSVTPVAAQARRAVAVIDGTAGPNSDPQVTALAARVDAQIDREDALVPVVSERRTALIGGVPGEALAGTLEARAALARSRDARGRFQERTAIDEATSGITGAVRIAPSAEISLLLGDLALARGLARMDAQDADGAAHDFALVHRLDPSRELDPVVYLPEVRSAFARAATPGAIATLEVEAPAGSAVWIDGIEVGAAPATVQVSVGLHCVTVTGDPLVPDGQIVEVPAAGSRTRIEAAEASGTTMVHRLRSALAAADDDATAAELVAALVRMVGGLDAVLVDRDADGALVTRIYSGRTGTLGEPQAAQVEGSDDWRPASDIVAPLRPMVKPDGDPDPDGGLVTPPVLPPAQPWYRRRWVQASVGGAVVAGVLTTVVVLLTRPEGESTLSEIGFQVLP